LTDSTKLSLNTFADMTWVPKYFTVDTKCKSTPVTTADEIQQLVYMELITVMKLSHNRRFK